MMSMSPSLPMSPTRMKCEPFFETTCFFQDEPFP